MNVTSLFQKLTAHIPGYAGYTDRERRRDTDQALRRAVAQRLADRKAGLDRLIAEASRTMRYDALDPLESAKRRLDRLADLLRHAPAGYAGLFDAQQVLAGELDRLTEHDSLLRDAAEALAASLDVLTLRDADAVRRIDRELTALEDAVRRRDELLKGVA